MTKEKGFKGRFGSTVAHPSSKTGAEHRQMLETLHSGAQVRGPHNPEAAGSNPVPATMRSNLGISMIPRFFYARNGLIPTDLADLLLVTSNYF